MVGSEGFAPSSWWLKVTCSTVELRTHMNWSGRLDSNQRQPASEAGTLASLSYTLFWSVLRESNPHPLVGSQTCCPLTPRTLELNWATGRRCFRKLSPHLCRPNLADRMGFEPMTSRLTTERDHQTAPTVRDSGSLDRRPGFEPGSGGSKPPVLPVAPSPSNAGGPGGNRTQRVDRVAAGRLPTWLRVLTWGSGIGWQERTRTSIILINSQVSYR